MSKTMMVVWYPYVLAWVLAQMAVPFAVYVLLLGSTSIDFREPMVNAKFGSGMFTVPGWSRNELSWFLLRAPWPKGTA